MSTPPTPASNTSRPTLSDAVDRLLAQFADGKRVTWDKRLNDTERFECFKTLADARGARYAAATLENYSAEPGRQANVKGALWAMRIDGMPSLRDGGGLILYGPQGTGKDHLQFAMLRHAVLEWGYSAAWRDGMRLQDEMRRAIGDGNESDLRRRLSEPQILAISDPLPPSPDGKGELNAWNLGFLRDVIDRRYSELKSTWFTFNGTSRKDLDPILSPPLAARMVDSSVCIHCNWPTYRKPAREF